jgi:hypothetical protein
VIALLNQLRNNTDRNLARLIGAKLQPDGTLEGAGAIDRNSGGGKFLEQHGSLGFTADDAYKREMPILLEDFFEDWAIGGVAHRHADDKCIARKFGDKRARLVGLNLSQTVPRRNAIQPIGSRIDTRDVAIEWRQANDDRGRYVTCTENYNPPVAVIVRFEKNLYRTTAGHADVALQIPFQQFGYWLSAIGCRPGKHRLRVLDRFVLDAAAAHGAGVHSAGRHQHLTAGVLWRASHRVDHRHTNERHAASRQLGQSFDKSMRRGHMEQGAGEQSV